MKQSTKEMPQLQPNKDKRLPVIRKAVRTVGGTTSQEE